MPDFPFVTQALTVRQPFGTFFVAVISADLLREVAFSDIARVVEVDPAGYRIAGTQRAQRQERWKEIGKFIDTIEAVFPTSIVLAANYTEDGSLEEDDAQRWRVDGQGRLTIPTSQKLASVVDGQHRLWGFEFATDPERKSMPLVCSIFIDLPNPFQAYVFATVNFNQKKVDRSLAYELFGFDTDEEPPEAWTPEKTAVFLTRRFNIDEESPLRGRIVVAAQDDDSLTHGEPGWQVSTATVVDGLLRLFSRNPKADRSAMLTVPRAKRQRKALPDDHTPAREFFRATNDKAIYALASGFMSAVKVSLWDHEPAGSFLTRTVGVQALFDVLRDVAPDAIRAKNLSSGYFSEMLARARGADFTNPFFHASGAGRVRIKHTLKLRMGIEQLDEVPPGDRAQYEAIALGPPAQARR